MRKRLQRAAAIGMAALLCVQNAQFGLTTFADELSNLAKREAMMNTQGLRVTSSDTVKNLSGGAIDEDSDTGENGEIRENPDGSSEGQENEQDDMGKASDSDAKKEENSGTGNTVKKDEIKKFQIQSFEWGDPEEYPKGEPVIASVTEEMRASFEELAEALPQEIRAIVSEEEKAENPTTDENEEQLQDDSSREEVIPIVSWTCPEYKTDEDGKWPLSGEFTFAAELPGEYEVADSCDAVEMRVVIDSEVMTLSQSDIIMAVYQENKVDPDRVYYDGSSKQFSCSNSSVLNSVSADGAIFVLRLNNSNCSTWKRIHLLSGKWRIEVTGEVTLGDDSNGYEVLYVGDNTISCVIRGDANSRLNINGLTGMTLEKDTEITGGMTVNVSSNATDEYAVSISPHAQFWVNNATLNVQGKMSAGSYSKTLVKNGGTISVEKLEQDGFSSCTIEKGGTLKVEDTWEARTSEITNNGTITLDGQLNWLGQVTFTNNGEINGNGSLPDRWKKTPQITRKIQWKKIQRSTTGDTRVDLTDYFQISNSEQLELKYAFTSDSDTNGEIVNNELIVPSGQKGTFRIYARTDGNGMFRAAKSDLYAIIEIVDPVINRDEISIESYRGEYDGMPHDVAIVSVPEGAKVEYNTKPRNAVDYDPSAWTEKCPQITTPDENGRAYYVRVTMAGMEDYYHSEAVQANILAKSLTEQDCQVMYRGQLLSVDSPVVQELTYSGKTQSPEYEVYYNGKRLIAGEDYQRGYTRLDGNRIREGFTFGYSIYGTSGRYNMNIKKDSIFKIVPAPLENLYAELVYVDGQPRIVPSSKLEDELDMSFIYIRIRREDGTGAVSGKYIYKEDNYAIDTENYANGDYIISYEFRASNYGDITEETETTGAYQQYKTGELSLHIGPYEFAEDDLTIKFDGTDDTNTSHTYDGKSHTITVEPSEALTESADVTVTYKVETSEQNETAGQDTVSDSFTSDAPKLKNAGTYTISYKVNATDKTGGTAYTEKSGSVTVTITKKELKVKADPCEVNYLDVAPAYSVTYDGWEGEDGIDVVSGQVSFNCDYEAGKSVGIYPITPDVSGLLATNYTFAAVSENLTVKLKTPVITAVGYENGSDGTQGWKNTTYSDRAPQIRFQTDRIGEENHDAEDIAFVVTDLTTNQTLEQNTVPVRAGSYSVVASVPEGANYSAATSEAYPFVISKRTMNPEDFLVEGFEGSYDGNDHAVSVAVKSELLKKNNPQITYKRSDSTTSTESPKFTNAGEYVVEFQVTADNYENYTGTAAVKIEKKDLTVTAVAKTPSITYFDEKPEFSVIYGTFVDGETENVLGGTLEFTCDYTKGKPVGTYTITPKGLTSDNYNLIFMNGTLTVERKPLTVTAENKQVTYKEDAPEFTAVYDGFAGEETLESVGGTISFLCEYESGNPVGDYEIQPEVTGLANYEVTANKGTLSVLPRTPEFVDSENLYTTRVYDGKAVDLTPTTDGDGEMSFVITNRETNEVLTSDPVDVGKYHVIYSFAAGTNYSAGSVAYDFDITPAPLKITAADQKLLYLDEIPEYTAEYDGFVNGENLESAGGTVHFDCSYQKGTTVGSYPINLEVTGLKNYEVTTESGMMTVEKRTPVFTDSTNLYTTRVYDGKAVDLTPTTDGDGKMSRVITNRETNEVLTSDPVDVGEYRVVYSVSEGKNYTEGSVSYDFAITPAPLVITAEDKNVTFGSKAPEYTVIYDGFVNDETEAVLTGTLVVTCDYTVESRESAYEIIPFGLSAKNYAITWKNGVLTGQYPESDSDDYEETSKPANSKMPKSGTNNSAQGATTKDAQKGYVNENSGIVSGKTLTEEMLTNNSESLNDGYSHWIKTDAGWWFRYADGSYPKAAKAANSGFGSSSAAQSYEWVQIDGSWWSFDSNGYLGTGWILDPVYGNWFYVDANTGMKTGWVLINGKWYYFNTFSDGTKGIMFANRLTPDGWFVREDGSWDEKR